MWFCLNHTGNNGGERWKEENLRRGNWREEVETIVRDSKEVLVQHLSMFYSDHKPRINDIQCLYSILY